MQIHVENTYSINNYWVAPIVPGTGGTANEQNGQKYQPPQCAYDLEMPIQISEERVDYSINVLEQVVANMG